MGVLDGILKGGSTGAALGPAGAVAGAGIGLATGLIQNIQANKLKKQADAAMPELVDPNQAAYLSELNQKRKSIASGAAFSTAMQQADMQQASANDAITRNSGGDSGSAIQALLQAQANSGNIKNQALANGQQQQMGYDSMYGNQLNKIAARTLQLQLLESQQKRAEWAKKKQFAGQNTQAGGATALQGLLGSLGGGAGASSPDGATGVGGMLSGKPAGSPLDTFTPTGESAPGVTPQQNLATGALGPLIDL